MTTTRSVFGAALLMALAGLGACKSSPESATEKEAMTSQAEGTVQAFEAADPDLRGLLDKSVGYAVFPDVGKAGFIVGGGHGRGEVYENGRLIGYAAISQGSIGLQAGAQTYAELIVFLNQAQLQDFKSDQFAFSANASAVAIKPGAAAAADHSKGVVVFVKPKGGLMAEASIGGQKFDFEPLPR